VSSEDEAKVLVTTLHRSVITIKISVQKCNMILKPEAAELPPQNMAHYDYHELCRVSLDYLFKNPLIRGPGSARSSSLHCFDIILCV
jgi:hypothetical protein